MSQPHAVAVKDASVETQDELSLDPVTQEYIADLQKQVAQIQERAMVAMQTSLELECRRRKLKGAWKISEDGTKLIRDYSAESKQ